jgi:hypothetical protein
MNSKEAEYESRIRSQIAQYANPDGLLKLGPILPLLDQQAHSAAHR